MKASYRSTFGLVLVISAGGILSGCLAFEPEDGEDLGVAEQAIITTNALTPTALMSNWLTGNDDTAEALVSQPLTTSALTTNWLVRNALGDSTTREFFFYVVSCALPTGAHVDVTLNGAIYGFDGQIGLAPQWGNASGSCDAQCREWVSACVLGRVNYLGLSRSISARGSKSALALSADEAIDYPNREASYFGDIFEQPQVRFACLSPGKNSIPRVCGPSIDSCVVDVVGSCDSVCSSVHPSTGAFANCRENAAAKWYPAVTVYLP